MARYLTPAKIGLLALIELYADEAVPSNAILPVLSFITSHLVDTVPQHAAPASPWQKTTHTTTLLLSIHAFEDVLTAHPVLLGMPGRRLWDGFLQKLWSVDSLDALHSFFSRLALVLQPGREDQPRHEEEDDADDATRIRICKTSVFGIFVRRCQLEFERPQFHDSAELWKGFVKYRQPTAAYLRKKHPGFDRLQFDNVSLMGEGEDPAFEALTTAVYGDGLTGFSAATVPMSTDDLEGLLEFQVEQMQRYGNRVPLGIRQKLQDLVRDSHLIPSVSHYVNFLDSWRAGDHPNAFDNLHRYFDYTMQNRDRLFYQYALMNLAVLQSEFGCYAEAVDAMLQAVSTARENRDMTCLNFALNWLFHFGRAHPSLVKHIDPASTLGSARETLAFLRVRARETSMSTLLSTLLLSEAKLTLSDGESIATALENVVRSSHSIIERNARSLLPTHALLVASLWHRLGLADLAASTCEVALRAHAPHGVFDDALRLTCRLAMGLADRGRYDDALRLLDGLDGNALRAWKTHQHWRKCRGVVKLRRDLARGDLDGARDLLSQLLQNRADDLEPDMAFAVDLLRADYLVRRGDLAAASDLVEDLLEAVEADDTRDVALRVELLLLKTNLLRRAGRPLRGLSLAARAASIALRARLLPLLYRAAASLSAILISLSEFGPAASLLRSALPRALEARSSSLSAALYSLLADAEMGLAGAAPPGRQRAEKLTAAAAALDRAFGFYAEGGETALAREAVAKRGVVMRALDGGAGAGAEVAARYVSLLDQEARRIAG